MDGLDTFPRRYARTQRFTLGQPRGVTVSPDGDRVVFLRSASGDDPATGLWVLDLPSGTERLVADPGALGADQATLTLQERQRRERLREGAAGITSYATDRNVMLATFAIGGRLFVADLMANRASAVPVRQSVADPHLDPGGERIAYAAEGGVFVVDVGGIDGLKVAGVTAQPDVTWGLAEFVAAEEMDRTRGFWWSPDGRALAVARVDTSGVQRWHLGDPTDPATPPQAVAYPAAGTPNADVSLFIVPLHGGELVSVDWDRGTFPYLADVGWGPDGPLTLVVQSRDQRSLRILAAGPDGGTSVVREQHDRHWVDLVPGTPRWLPDGRLVTTVDREDTRSLLVGDVVLTAPGLQVRGVAGVTGDAVVLTASTEATEIDVWRVPLGGGDPVALHRGGTASAAIGGRTVVVAARTMDRFGVETVAHGQEGDSILRSVAAAPDLSVRVELLRLGDRALRAALVLPNRWTAAAGALPVLLDPYGGPHAQRVLASRDGYLVSQWFAEAGMAVLVIDGRGTPGRGPAWDRTVAGDLATAPLADQVDGLHAAASLRPGVLDLARVAIRGWSFGGFLAALAVLRRPDVFHAAIAGAPVTDFRLYDTHYTERYLGTPDAQPDAYAASSLMADAAALARPLLLIHGLSDDNVVAAHTLRLSRALLEAGRPHTVLPLSGVTHMTPQETVAENLLRLQLEFLRAPLALTARVRSGPRVQ